MTESTRRDQVLATITEEIAETRARAAAETDPARRERLTRHADIREEVAEEEAEAIAAEIAENQQSALSVRVPADLLAELKSRAAAEQMSVSAFARRLLVQVLLPERSAPVLTVEQVEEIARRVYRESA